MSRSDQRSSAASSTIVQYHQINPISTYLNPDLLEPKKHDDLSVTNMSATDNYSSSSSLRNAVLILNNLNNRNSLLNSSSVQVGSTTPTAEYKKCSTGGLPALYENSVNNIRLFNFNSNINQRSNTDLFLKNPTKH